MSDQQENASSLRERIAGQIGEEASKLSIMRDSATILSRMQEGVIIMLHIEGTRRFWKKLTLADLGLAMEDDPSALFSDEASSVLATYFQLGRLSLLPSRKQIAGLPEAEQEKFVTQEDLATLERSARYSLERHSFKSHWGSFVPVTKYEAWKEENASYEAAFIALKEKLIANYDHIVANVIHAYRPIAQDAWRMVQVNRQLMRRPGQSSVNDSVIREVAALLQAERGKETFIENYLTSIRRAIRSGREVEASFAYTVERSIIPLPSLLAADLEQTDRLYAERAIREEQVQAELERIGAERRALESQAWNTEREATEKRQLALQAERERLRLQAQMERDILAAARADKERLLQQFYTDVIGQVNDQLQLVCSNVLESLDEHQGTLRGPVSQSLRNLVTQLEGLNFMEDQGVEAMLSRIREALPTQEESRQAAKGLAKIDTTRLQTVLRQVKQQASTMVIDLGMTPSMRRPRREEAIATEGLVAVDGRRQRRTAALNTTANQSSTTRRKPRVS